MNKNKAHFGHINMTEGSRLLIFSGPKQQNLSGIQI